MLSPVQALSSEGERFSSRPFEPGVALSAPSVVPEEEVFVWKLVFQSLAEPLQG